MFVDHTALRRHVGYAAYQYTNILVALHVPDYHLPRVLNASLIDVFVDVMEEYPIHYDKVALFLDYGVSALTNPLCIHGTITAPALRLYLCTTLFETLLGQYKIDSLEQQPDVETQHELLCTQVFLQNELFELANPIHVVVYDFF